MSKNAGLQRLDGSKNFACYSPLVPIKRGSNCRPLRERHLVIGRGHVMSKMRGYQGLNRPKT